MQGAEQVLESSYDGRATRRGQRLPDPSVSRHGSRMRRHRSAALLALAPDEENDGFAPSHAPQRGNEPGSVAQPFQIEADDVRFGIINEPVQPPSRRRV